MARCEPSDFAGSYVVHFEPVSGTCGTPKDEDATISDPASVAPCERTADDVWSNGGCTWKQSVRCAGLDFDSELTLRPDGSIVGTETRTVPGACVGTYAVMWTRQ